MYLALSRIVVTTGTNDCRVSPLTFPRLFIPCDVVSILLQAIGGSMASVATSNHNSPHLGVDIMVVGFAFQALTLGLFILICADFAITKLLKSKAAGTDGALDAKNAEKRPSWRFQGFVAALALATLCIFIRSTYRVIELAHGWEGSLIGNEKLFIILEGAMMVVAALALNTFHPGWCFPEGYEESMSNLLKKFKGQSIKSLEDEKLGE